jgi:nicotinamide riboside transporter PnuC
MADQSTGLQQWSIATVSIVTTLAFLFVCLRLLSRYERKQALWWDDWMIIFSMVFSLLSDLEPSTSNPLT